MKRAQMISQVFVFIIAALVFILILFYGYRAISQFGQRSEQVALLDFEKDFSDAVKSTSLRFGSVRRLDINLPSRYTEICVLCDPALDTPKCSIQDEPSIPIAGSHPLIYQSWKGGSQNVFLTPLADTQILIENMEVKNVGECIPVAGGRASLKLEGRGDRTLVSKWPSQT